MKTLTNEQAVAALVEQRDNTRSQFIKDRNNKMIANIIAEEKAAKIDKNIKEIETIGVGSTLQGGVLKYRVNGGRSKEYYFTSDELAKLFIENGIIG